MPRGSATGMRIKVVLAEANTFSAKKPGSARRMPQGSALGIGRDDFFTKAYSRVLLCIECEY